MTLHTQSLTSLDEIRAFLEGNAAVVFTAPVAEQLNRAREKLFQRIKRKQAA